ncbi:MAG TPA: prolyl oligopeptidase family serine peptidase [Thermomicrobiales bacterium]|nr:prolyl oligopeptidase family serine peptidase [Thermomicrobiales bacterium]
MATDVMFPDRAATNDTWQWLEGIYDDDALKWVDEQNARTMGSFDALTLQKTAATILEILDSDDRIPMIAKHGEYYYNFWRDAEHPRGLWRRTTLESYRTPKPDWGVLLDIDALGREEGVEWVFAGAQMLPHSYDRALLRLSPDGGDAVVIREFDVESREFVADGFSIPHAKSQVSWIDRDTIFVGSDFGPGTMTTSSYPRQARRWRRGEPLETAEIIHEIPEDHMALWAYHDSTPGFERDVLIDRVDFFSGKTYVLRENQPIQVDIPDDADAAFHREWLLVRTRSRWEVGGETYPAGSLLAANADAFLGGDRHMTALFTPDKATSLVAFEGTRNHLLLTLLKDVSTRIEVLTSGTDGWTRSELGSVEPNQRISVSAVDADDSDDFWLVVTGFLQPPTLQLGSIGRPDVETLKTSPSFFNESRFKVEQHFATSKDGTRVPYFQVSPTELEMSGRNPTLLTGYGGFQIPMLPQYDGIMGKTWLEEGGVYVVANIRGGGEYGPDWHHAARRENRHRAYEDFAAVAQDLVGRGVTSPAHLGCMGGSNGGLLVGNMLTHYPDLFGAIVCQVPLLDMKRYTKLSAGYSWIAEYGDPDNDEEWAFIQNFSPYHNLREGVSYPPVLFYTATSDDRVGPVQARKMAARMQERGIPNVLFYENRQGGHAGSADNAQRAHMLAMSLEFLKSHLFG